MSCMILDEERLQWFAEQLREDEKSRKTVEKYYRDGKKLMAYAAGRPLSKDLIMEYKEYLRRHGYAPRSINSMLASVNSLLHYLELESLRVKNVRIQRSVYCAKSKELTKEEYLRLLEAAKKHPRTYLILMTLCSTGIRVSELSFFTVEAVRRGEVRVNAKGKDRVILLPEALQHHLLEYARMHLITRGILFRTRSGQPMDRSNIWADLKALCRTANVQPDKVYPHNLRKLFARSFYEVDNDLARLADVLGHSSVDTTRIYIVSSGTEHRRKLESLGLAI